jgi:hypothetical protein
MDDFPTKIADYLEQTATRVRALTVDRIAVGVRWTAAGIVLAVLGFLLALFLLIGIFRLLGELIGIEVTYAVFGGLFVILGVFLLSRRKPQPDKE